MNQKRLLAALIVVIMVCAGVATQAVQSQSLMLDQKALSGSAFTYQGYLKVGGSPANGTFDFEFMLYYSASKAEDELINGPKIILPIAKDNVQVSDGLFSVDLDFGNVYDGQQLYLQIGVRPGAETGAYTYLTPRQPIRAAPYALGLVPGASIIGTLNSQDIFTVQNLGTDGAIYASTAGNATAITGFMLSGTGSSSGVYGKSTSTTGRGVTGENTAASGINYGVYGSSLSPDGFGVYGTGADGVFGATSNSTGRALYGDATAASGESYGVWSQNASTSGRAVYGLAYAVTGTNYGVIGTSLSTSGRGVYGSATAASGSTYGVRGENSSTDGRGVLGYATSTSGANYGVRGQTDSPAGYGGYFSNTNYTQDQNAVGVFADAYGGKDLVLGLSIPGGTGTTGSIFAGTPSQDGILNLFSYRDVWIDLDNDYDSSNSNFTIWNGLDELVFRVDEAGNVSYYGSKSVVVETKEYGSRQMYGVESTGAWFEDFGTADLEKGVALVGVDPIFAQTVNLTEDYHVFLTPLGDCPLYVSEKTASGFTVRAMGGVTCDIPFDYRIVAKRLGYEDQRLESISSSKMTKPATEELTLEGGESSVEVREP